MKKLIVFSFGIMNYLAYAAMPANIQELYKNVYIAWPSPTPHIQNRFNEFIKMLPKNAMVAEVGVQEGTFASFVEKHATPSKLVLIDCWEHQDPTIFDDPDANVEQAKQDELYRKVQRRFAHNPNVIVLKKYSHQAANMFDDEFFDWIYIDSNHSYEAVKQDLALWYPKVKKGGYLCGHDYINFYRKGFGIVQALNEFMRDNNLYFAIRTEGDVHESWAIQKP